MNSPTEEFNARFALDGPKHFVMLFKTYTYAGWSKILENLKREFSPLSSTRETDLLQSFIYGNDSKSRQFDRYFKESMRCQGEEFEKAKSWMVKYSINQWSPLSKESLVFCPKPYTPFTELQIQFIVSMRIFLSYLDMIGPFCEEFEVKISGNLATHLQKQRWELKLADTLPWYLRESTVSNDPPLLDLKVKDWIQKYVPRREVARFSRVAKRRLVGEAGLSGAPKLRSRLTLTEKWMADLLGVYLDDSVCISTIKRSGASISTTANSDKSVKSSATAMSSSSQAIGESRDLLEKSCHTEKASPGGITESSLANPPGWRSGRRPRGLAIALQENTNSPQSRSLKIGDTIDNPVIIEDTPELVLTSYSDPLQFEAPEPWLLSLSFTQSGQPTGEDCLPWNSGSSDPLDQSMQEYGEYLRSITDPCAASGITMSEDAMILDSRDTDLSPQELYDSVPSYFEWLQFNASCLDLPILSPALGEPEW